MDPLTLSLPFMTTVSCKIAYRKVVLPHPTYPTTARKLPYFMLMLMPERVGSLTSSSLTMLF